MGWRDILGLSTKHQGHHVNTTGRGKHSANPPVAKNPAKSKSSKAPKRKGA